MSSENLSSNSDARLEQAIAGLCHRAIPEFPNPPIDFPHATPPQPQGNDCQPSRQRRVRMTAVGGLSLAASALVLLITVTISIWPTDAWAQIVNAIQKRPWVRLSMSVPDNPAKFELWFSPSRRVAASRSPGSTVFVELDQQEVQHYDEKQGTITVSDATSFDEDEISMLNAIVQSFHSREELKVPQAAATVKLIGKSRQKGVEGDKSWTDFLFDFEDSRRSPPQYRRIFRVPSGTDLPARMTEEWTYQGKTGSRVFEMDYPDSGPVDLYSLNVPKDAKIVNIYSSSDLKAVLKAYTKFQTAPFDSYSAVMLTTVEEEGDWKWVNDIYKVRHDASGYSAEVAEIEPVMKLSMRIHEGQIVLPDAVAERLEWWKTEAGKLPSQRFGERETFFPGQSFVPSQVGYPLMGLPSNNVRATLDPKPSIGPSDTVMLTIEDAKSGSLLRRFWLAPDREFLCVRWEHVNKKSAEWISTTVVDTTEKSPQGHWYATQIRRGAVERSGDDLRPGTGVAPVGTVTSKFLVEFHK